MKYKYKHLGHYNDECYGSIRISACISVEDGKLCINRSCNNGGTHMALPDLTKEEYESIYLPITGVPIYPLNEVEV